MPSKNDCTIHDSRTGNEIGTTHVDADTYAEVCANPEGHVRADAILNAEDLDRLGISGDLSVYAILN